MALIRQAEKEFIALTGTPGGGGGAQTCSAPYVSSSTETIFKTLVN